MMLKLFAFVPAGLLFVSGCSSSAIPAHDLDAVVSYDGVTTRSVLAFPERDPEAAHTPVDSSCSFYSGNCGSDSPTYADVRGAGTPIARAMYTTLHTGEAGTYDIEITRTAEDQAAYERLVKEHGPGQPAEPTIFCRVYESELGTPQDCFYSLRPVTITLTRR
jgi:hypothetical protein